MFKHTLKDLYGFVKKPTDNQIHLSTKKKIHVFVVLLAIKAIVVCCIILPALQIINQYLNIADNHSTGIESFSLLKLYICTAIIVPLMEELMFRYPLRYKGLKTLFISKEIWHQKFPYIVYLSTILFAYIHLLNYTNLDWLLLLISPILLASHLVTGILAAYLRIRFNFIWAVLFHSVWNFVIISLPENLFG